MTPNGTYAFVANHTVGEVTIVRLSTMQVVGKVTPAAIRRQS